MILFLQQSSVEWASSLWLRVVQEVDPYFQRTVRTGIRPHIRYALRSVRTCSPPYLIARCLLTRNTVLVPGDRGQQVRQPAQRVR